MPPITPIQQKPILSNNLTTLALPLAVAAGGAMAAKAIKDEREQNTKEIKTAEENIETINIPSELASAGLTHQDLLNELHNTSVISKRAQSSAASELRGLTISTETLKKIAEAKGLSVKKNEDKSKTDKE